MNLHFAHRISSAHRAQLQHEPGTSRSRRNAIKPPTQLGGVGVVKEAGPGRVTPLRLKRRQLMEKRQEMMSLRIRLLIGWSRSGARPLTCRQSDPLLKEAAAPQSTALSPDRLRRDHWKSCSSYGGKRSEVTLPVLLASLYSHSWKRKRRLDKDDSNKTYVL